MELVEDGKQCVCVNCMIAFVKITVAAKNFRVSLLRFVVCTFSFKLSRSCSYFFIRALQFVVYSSLIVHRLAISVLFNFLQSVHYYVPDSHTSELWFQGST